MGEVSNSCILNDIGSNSLLGNGKKIAKFLMRTFTCRSTFLYGREEHCRRMPRNFISSSQFQRKQRKLGLLSIYKFSLDSLVSITGKGYTMHVHTAGIGGGGRDTQCTSKLQV
jgi:hypothetical protein